MLLFLNTAVKQQCRVMVQRDLVAARKALKLSLKELDSAEGDRARLQKQVNKLSRALQVTPQHCATCYNSSSDQCNIRVTVRVISVMITTPVTMNITLKVLQKIPVIIVPCDAEPPLPC